VELAPHTFRELTQLIRAETGIVLGPEKTYLVRHRLEPLVRSEGLAGFIDLVRQLRLHPGAALRDAVIDAITVKETQFFRDPSFFDVLLEHVLPACAAGKGDGGRVRIWSAAASTGQEAYSVAMLVRELRAAKPGALDESRVSILASDISPAAIRSATTGLYDRSEVGRGLSAARLQRHFHQHGVAWHVEDSLRRMVQFRTFNLLHASAEIGGFDLILCRNVLIYFDEAARRQVSRALFTALRDGGCLALGSAESLYGMEEQFETIMHGKSILYRKPLR
jgi:chemotaxis protein methyltransferase CheR